MYPMAQRTNYLQIFLRLCPAVRILLGFRAGMNKPHRATFYTVLSKGGFSLDIQAFFLVRPKNNYSIKGSIMSQYIIHKE